MGMRGLLTLAAIFYSDVLAGMRRETKQFATLAQFRRDPGDGASIDGADRGGLDGVCS